MHQLKLIGQKQQEIMNKEKNKKLQEGKENLLIIWIIILIIILEMIIISMIWNLIWHMHCHLFQKNICVKLSPSTPRHQHLKERMEIKTNVIFCKICQFEGRGNIHKGTVFCSNHGLSLS